MHYFQFYRITGEDVRLFQIIGHSKLKVELNHIDSRCFASLSMSIQLKNIHRSISWLKL